MPAKAGIQTHEGPSASGGGLDKLYIISNKPPAWTTGVWPSRRSCMKEYKTLSHSVWDCKYHIVFIPKYRQKKLYGTVRTDLRDLFHKLSFQKECRIEEGYLMPDHVHMLISIPPKYSVAHMVGFLKGKSALYLAQRYGRRRKQRGYHFWARGYFVTTVRYNEEVVRRYIQNQEKIDRQVEQQSLFKDY